MLGQKFTNAIMATVAAGALVVGLAGPANAVPVDLDGWNLNLSKSGLAGVSDAKNIDFILLDGTSTITQTLSGGSPVGQAFTDSGKFQLDGYHKEPSGSGFTPFSIGNDTLYFQFAGLTGTFNADGSITFNKSLSHPIQLILDDGSQHVLASFDIVPNSGGSGFGKFFGGAGPDATVDITLVESSGIDPSLYTDSSNTPLPLLTTLHLGDLNALNDPNFSPPFGNNPTFSGPGCNPATDGPTCTSALVHVVNAGQYNLAVNVPEPGTLSLLGGGLLLLGFAGMRRRKGA